MAVDLSRNIASKLQGGEKGKTIALKANFFQIGLDPKMKIQHYDVELKNAPTLRKARESMLQKFVAQYQKLLFKDASFTVHDGNKNIFTSAKVPEKMLPEGKRKTFEFEDRKRYDGKTDFGEISIRFAQEIPLSAIKAVFKRNERTKTGDNGSTECKIAIQAVDIALQHGFRMNDSYTNVGRNFFKVQQKACQDLGMGKEIWFGFHQSLRPCQRRMMLNVDVAATTFFTRQPLVQFLVQVVRKIQPELRKPAPKGKHNDKNKRDEGASGGDARKLPVPRDIDKRQAKEFEQEVKGLRVEAVHTEHKHRIARVCADYTAATMKFKDKEGKEVTVKDYFETNYKIRLQYPHLPLILLEPTSKKCYLPIEMLNVVPGQHYKKKLNGPGTALMVRSCAKRPGDRQKDIESYVKSNKYDKDATIIGLNAKVERGMTEISGRILPTPEVIYKEGGVIKPNMGAWMMTERGSKKSKQYYEPVKIDSWFIVCAENQKTLDPASIKDFYEKFINVAKDVGVIMSKPQCTYLKERDVKKREAEVDNLLKVCKKKGAQLLFAIIAPTDSHLYSKIKQAGDVKYGVHTQCLLSKNAKKPNLQLLGNVLLKVNAKLNGINNIVKSKTENGIMAEPTLIMGGDVTHPSPGEHVKPSVAALVGSMNRDASKYQCEVQAQTHRQEMIGGIADGQARHLTDMAKRMLKKFRENTGQKPRHIIYYRDGVAEGQFDELLTVELFQLHEACEQLEDGYKPNITVIVCQKRHHTRLFCKNEKDADRSKNTPPGTCVDSTITNPENFNFYLCSHAGIQGTSRPVHYNVVYTDHPDINGEDIQSLTFKLCHLYQRCNRSVSLPAPVYFAHLAAFRARTHIMGEHDLEADSKPLGSDISANSLQSKITIEPTYATKAQYYL